MTFPAQTLWPISILTCLCYFPLSPLSLSSGSSSHSSHSEHSPSIFEDLNSLEDTLLDRWNAQTQELAAYLLTACILEACPPVKKLGQLELYLTIFQDNHT